MLATYLSVIAVCAASLAIGQAALALCGWRRWSWLAPATGLALVMALCWATVRLPGDGVVSAIATTLAVIASIAFLRGRTDGLAEAVRDGLPVALAAILAASLPFIVEGRFGILGTGFNPDMSQHLLAADRLASGVGGQLLNQGYPLGPHAIVVALEKGLGVGLVQGFGGLTLAISVLACLTALGALRDLRPLNRWLAALLVGLPYLVASYLAQGAFKETAQALFVLAFAIGLWGISRGDPRGRLVGVPLAILAAGSVFTYSFAGLTWLIGALGIWAVAELLLRARADERAGDLLRKAVRPALLALVFFAVLVAPELGRMADFASFETFDPSGPGLGNLFGQISPAEALGVWPSGDFRLSPGDGAVPAIAFYAGVAFAAGLLAWGLVWWLRRGEVAVPAALASAAIAYAAARIGGTPYTTAKAVQMAAPLAMLVIARPLLAFEWPRPPSLPRLLRPAVAAAFVVLAGGCSLLALANAPVGPASYSSALTGFRPQIANGSTLALVPPALLYEQHGTRYVAWELRGGRVCIRDATDPGVEVVGPLSLGVKRGLPPPPGVGFVIAWPGAAAGPPFDDLRLLRRADGYTLWRRIGPAGGPSPCPLIAVRSARQGEKQGG